MKKNINSTNKDNKKSTVRLHELNTDVKSAAKTNLNEKDASQETDDVKSGLKRTSGLIIELIFTVLLLAAICALRTVHLYANNTELVTFAELGKSMWMYMGISIAVFAVLRIFLSRPYFVCMFVAFAAFFAVNFDLLVDLMQLFMEKYYNAAIGSLVLYVVLIAGFFLLLRVLYKKNVKLNIIAKILSVTFVSLVLFNTVLAVIAISKTANEVQVAAIDTTPAYTPNNTPAIVTETTDPTTEPTTVTTAEPVPKKFGMPNIYFFMLDEYSSFDMLSKYYGYSNGAFDRFLTENGFNLSRESYATDNQTGHAIADLLNMEYMSRYISTNECISSIPDSAFFTTLSELGYSQFQMSTSNKYFKGIVSLRSDEGEDAYEEIINMFGDEEADDIVSESSITEALSELFGGEDIDAVIHEDPNDINEWGVYSSEYIRDTRAFKDHNYKSYINLMLTIFDYYENPSNYNPTAPRATYTYMTAAHVPFVFNQYGTVLSYNQSRNWEDTNVYLGQLKFITKRMTAAISTIIENDPNSIIIIMSDHGIRYHADCSKKHTFYITDKDSCRIMNAVYIKGEQYDIEGLSGINTLRYVLSLYEGIDFPSIEDPITSESPDKLRGIIPKPR